MFTCGHTRVAITRDLGEAVAQCYRWLTLGYATEPSQQTHFTVLTEKAQDIHSIQSFNFLGFLKMKNILIMLSGKKILQNVTFLQQFGKRTCIWKAQCPRKKYESSYKFTSCTNAGLWSQFFWGSFHPCWWSWPMKLDCRFHENMRQKSFSRLKILWFGWVFLRVNFKIENVRKLKMSVPNWRGTFAFCKVTRKLCIILRANSLKVWNTGDLAVRVALSVFFHSFFAPCSDSQVELFCLLCRKKFEMYIGACRLKPLWVPFYTEPNM